MQRVLVTAALGNVGREVVRALAARGALVRAGVREPSQTAVSLGPTHELVKLDFHDPQTFEPAVKDCDGLFLLRPPPISDVEPTLNRLVSVALTQGVRQIVFLSVAGAGKNRLVPHHAVEAHLRASTNGFTILRPGFFAQNLGDAYRGDIVKDDRIYVPAGDGRVAFVHLRDVAELAAMAFQEPELHRQQAYELTGPQAVSFHTVVRALSASLGRPIRYEPASILGYVRHLSRSGLPLAQVLVQTILHVGLRWGQAERVSPELERLLGRRPLTVQDYIRDNLPLWRRPEESAATS